MNNIALEAIAFQGTAFFDALTEAFAKLREAAQRHSDKIPSELPEGKAITAVILKHTNLSVAFMPQEPDVELAIFCPRLANGHIFESVFGWNDAALASFNHSGRDLLKKYKDGFAKGSVDIRKNWVDGFFAEIPFQLYIRDSYLVSGLLTVEELAAAVLHEVGHAFSQCEYVSRTVTTNQVLAEILQADSAGHEKKLTFVIVAAAHEQELTEKQKMALLLCKKPEDYIITAYAVADERCRSELGYSVYESTSCEQLADMYAARCGAGRHLVTGLNKLHERWGHYDESRRAYRAAWGFFNFLVVKFYIGALVAIVAGPMMGLLIALLLTVFSGAQAVATTSVMLGFNTYDDPVTRFDRIRHQLIQLLKDRQVNPKLAKSVLSDIREIDAIVRPLRENEEGSPTHHWAHHVALWLNAVYRKKYDSELLQKQLESLANNNLFVAAAKLQTL
jgi:hypothetical protein